MARGMSLLALLVPLFALTHCSDDDNVLSFRGAIRQEDVDKFAQNLESKLMAQMEEKMRKKDVEWQTKFNDQEQREAGARQRLAILVNSIKIQVSSLKIILVLLKRDTQQLKAQSKTTVKQLENVQTEMTNATMEIKQAVTERTLLKSEIAENIKTIQVLQRGTEQLRISLNRTEADVDTKMLMQKQEAAVNYNNLDNQIAQVKLQIGSAKSNVNDLSIRLTKADRATAANANLVASLAGKEAVAAGKRRELTEDLSKVHTKIKVLVDQINKPSTWSVQQVNSLKNLLSNTDTDINKLETQMVDTKKEVFITKAGITDLEKRASFGNSQRADLYKKIADTNRKVQIGTWPQGHYCIFRSGKCPAGFKQTDGRLAAILMWRKTDGYVKEAKFGDSQISCHNGACSRGNNNHANLYLSTCCK